MAPAGASGNSSGVQAVAATVNSLPQDQEQQIAAAARDLVAIQNSMARENLQMQQEEQAVGGDYASEDLMAAVNNDLARQVPRAMDPLVHMMDDSVVQ
jgi:hypothetical protein